jgi:hypothetical protein
VSGERVQVLREAIGIDREPLRIGDEPAHPVIQKNESHQQAVARSAIEPTGRVFTV